MKFDSFSLFDSSICLRNVSKNNRTFLFFFQDPKTFFSMVLTKRNAGLPLICLICGDVARGINFDVMSCMSCKAFFRRHAAKTLKVRTNLSSSSRSDRKRLISMFSLLLEIFIVLSFETKLWNNGEKSRCVFRLSFGQMFPIGNESSTDRTRGSIEDKNCWTTTTRTTLNGMFPHCCLFVRSWKRLSSLSARCKMRWVLLRHQ